MNQRTQFVLRALAGEAHSGLCREHGISRKTGYKWIERYKELGASGLRDASRRPSSHRQQLSEETLCEIVKLKVAHLKWGPKKIRELYRRKHGAKNLPSLSSFKRVLTKAGLTEKRKKRIRVSATGRLSTGRKAENPNDIWTIDFKGWWRDKAGLKVEPLTIRDEFSRKILDIRLLASCRTEAVKACFERLFKVYGLPKAIRSDNGSPFANSRSLLGLSRLSSWWLAHGIELERGRPGCPQDNGSHERMHLDIYRELQREGIGFEQASFDIWREEYNEERPHEALGMRTPDEVYEKSSRKYRQGIEELSYPRMMERRVHRQLGTIQFEGECYKLTSAIGGWNVGLKVIDEERIEIWFAEQLLGQIDPTTRKFTPYLVEGREAGKPEEKVRP